MSDSYAHTTVYGRHALYGDSLENVYTDSIEGSVAHKSQQLRANFGSGADKREIDPSVLEGFVLAENDDFSLVMFTELIEDVMKAAVNDDDVYELKAPKMICGEVLEWLAKLSIAKAGDKTCLDALGSAETLRSIKINVDWLLRGAQ